MLTDEEIVDSLLKRGLSAPQTEAERAVVIETVRTLERPRFCGVSEHIAIGGVQYGTWPESTLRYCISGTHPKVKPDVWRRIIQNSLDEYHDRFVLDFVEVTDPGEAHLLYTIANLGGVGGVLAQAGLCPFGLQRNDDFQSRIEWDRNDNFVEELVGAVMEILGVEVGKHETGHSMGAPHHSVPNSLLNAVYNPKIRGLQPADIELLVKLGLPLRTKPAAPAPPPPTASGKRLIGTNCAPGTVYTFKGFGYAVDQVA